MERTFQDEPIPSVTHDELREHIRLSFDSKIPLFVWGTFGIGKSFSTKIVAALIAKELNLRYSESHEDMNKEDTFMMKVVPAHQLDPAMLMGIPFANAERTATTFLPIDYLPRKGHGALFLDELPLAPPLVQSNLYQIALDRRLGNYRLPDGYFVIAAGNLSTDRSHGFEMAYPLKNRFMHVQLAVPTVETWVKNFALQHKIHNWIINYLNFQEQDLHNFNPDKDEEVVAIATPRSWEFASTALHKVNEDNLTFIERVVGSACGISVAKKFIAFLRLSKSYDIASIYRTKKFDVPSENQTDQIYALIAAMISYYQKQSTPENAVALLDFAPKFSKEHAVMLLSQAKYADNEWFNKIKKEAPDKWKKTVGEYIKFLL